MTPTRRSLPLALALAMVAVAVLSGPAAASQWAGDEQRLVDSINAERRAAGLSPLGVDAELQRVARAWSGVMAGEDRLYHNPQLPTQVQRDWRLLGENVGWSQDAGASTAALVDQVHKGFMDSPDHRANVLRAEYNWIGVGLRVTPAGKLWATVIFMQGAGQAPGAAPPPAPAPSQFRDVNGGPHAAAIAAIARHGITQGCSPDRFCPASQVTRGQMATFLVRALDLPAAGGDYFSDDHANPHQAAINALVAAGIANGCAPGRFCPAAPVTRAQMASFLQRALNLPAPTSLLAVFSDLGTSVHAPAIAAILQAGITQGCAPGRFCPNQPVRRDAMASFLARALGLV